MSTRASIIVQDKQTKLYLYRHSDGYPDGTANTLHKFMQMVADGQIRNNPEQAAGWLIMLGAMEYQTVAGEAFEAHGVNKYDFGEDAVRGLKVEDWKVGAYEPAIGVHGDIEWLYTLDLEALIITEKNTHEEKQVVTKFSSNVLV